VNLNAINRSGASKSTMAAREQKTEGFAAII
jgi:hypothetical protein